MSEGRFDPLQGVLVNKDGTPNVSFQVYWQKFTEALDGALTDLETVNTEQTSLLNQILAARKEDARTASYTSSGSILSAADVGADATITIAAHTRIYPGTDIADVALTGGTITGLAFSTLYYVYYDDTTLANTAPTFLATTTPATAQTGAAAGRHFVGSVTTPANGAAGTTGTGGIPPSFGTQLP